MDKLDLTIRNGTVATAAETMRCDIGIAGEKIVAIAEHLPAGERDIDAGGRYVLPGGIDSHCHIEQLSGMGIMSADDFYSGTVSAAFGGTTTIIPFAAQHRGTSVTTTVADYHERARTKAVIDYGFHLIIGEPTDMQVVNAHKGIRSFRTTVTGREAHSSQTDKGVNAVMVAAELIVYLAGIAEDMRRRGDPSGRFDPPYTTTQAATIEGGTALNILARHCTFQWEYRCLPGSSETEIHDRFVAHVAQHVLPPLKKIAAEANIVTAPRSRVPPLLPARDCPAEALARQLTGRNSSEAVSYGTEAGLFQEAGIPSVVCGPGNILQAHKPNEFIKLSQVEACTAFMRRLIDQVRAD